MEFSDIVSWASIATGAGAVVLVIAFTELSKNIESFEKLPTQLVSYVIAVIIMVLATIFTNENVGADDVILAILNSAIVSFSANGAYIAYKRVTNKNNLDDKYEENWEGE